MEPSLRANNKQTPTGNNNCNDNTNDNMSERETTTAISKVEGEIEKVEAQIEKVEKQLENKSLPKDEIDYLRKDKEQLRKEKEQLRTEKILILQSFKEQQQQQQGFTSQAQFRQLLHQCNVTPSEGVMNVILKQFASSATLVDTPEQARNLYLEAARLPRSVTKIALGEKGISVADVFRGSDPSRAVLLHAHENGRPRILKIATDKSIRHEWDVWSAVASVSSHHEDTYLASVQLLQFESAEVELGDFSGGHSSHPPARCGLLMKHFQGTLSQCKIPLTAEILLRYGKYLQIALSTMHRAGFCHLDVKPSNVFLFEDACYLGDYGAAVKTGDPIRERTAKYYPKDGDFEAREDTDMYLLAVTLLEMFGTIPGVSERSAMTKQEIHEKIASAKNDEVRIFLSSLFE